VGSNTGKVTKKNGRFDIKENIFIAIDTVIALLSSLGDKFG
jgi:hypothetical protein